MSEPELPDGYWSRHPVLEDAPGVAALIDAYEEDVYGQSEMTSAWLVDDWNEIDLTDEAVIVIAPDDQIVASADIFNGSYSSVSVYCYVHPEHRKRGLGTFLIQWGEQWTRDHINAAPAGAQVAAQFYPALVDEQAHQLLVKCGYQPTRRYFIMEMALDQPPEPARWPAGITVRPFVPGQDEQETFETFAESFQDHWGPPESHEAFLQRISADSFNPDLWLLAFEGEELAGVCLCRLVEGSGWVDSLGVRAPWRRRGLGLALLRHAFAELHRHGATDVGLSVDVESSTGAPRLYERAGMSVKHSYIMHQKILRPGFDLNIS